MAKTLNTWTLAGLMVGPILGSGVILLPPLAYEKLGAQALWAWVVILALGAAFATVFIRMALRTRSDSGVADLVAREWGPTWGRLASNYLTGAVTFGAVPVFLTAARLWPGDLAAGLPAEALAALFLMATTGLLLAGLTTVSRLSLVLSSTTAVLLVAGGILGLVWEGPPVVPTGELSLEGLGPTLLTLFWAVVGWEVIGNYSNDVEHPEKTVPRAGFLSLAAVSLVYFVTTLALQTLAPHHPGPPTVTSILVPLFGAAAGVVAGVLGGGLCLTALLMFIGAVTRMTAQRAALGEVPRWLAQPRPGVPRRAILVHAGVSVGLLTSVVVGWTSLETLVQTANVFFLGNALLGLAAAWKVLPGAANRLTLGVLAAVLVVLLAQAQPLGWVFFALVTGATLVQALRSSPPS